MSKRPYEQALKDGAFDIGGLIKQLAGDIVDLDNRAYEANELRKVYEAAYFPTDAMRASVIYKLDEIVHEFIREANSIAEDLRAAKFDGGLDLADWRRGEY